MARPPFSFSGLVPAADHHVELRRSVAKLVGKYGRKYFQEQVRKGEKVNELWSELGDAGFLGVHISEKWGGGGGGMSEYYIVVEETAAQGCPLFTMVLAQWFVPGERMTAAKVAGFGLGIAGVVVLIGPAALIAKGGAVEEVARLSCVAAALSYSIGSVVTRRCPPMHMVAFSAAALLCAGFMAVPMALLVEGVPDLAAAPVRAGLAVVYLGLLPTALATVLMVRVINGAGPVFLTLSNYQVPVWSVIFGVLVLGERLPGQFLAALGLILAGLAVTQAGGWMRWSR